MVYKRKTFVNCKLFYFWQITSNRRNRSTIYCTTFFPSSFQKRVTLPFLATKRKLIYNKSPIFRSIRHPGKPKMNNLLQTEANKIQTFRNSSPKNIKDSIKKSPNNHILFTRDLLINWPRKHHKNLLQSMFFSFFLTWPSFSSDPGSYSSSHLRSSESPISSRPHGARTRIQLSQEVPN